jgi:hypothetical protein
MVWNRLTHQSSGGWARRNQVFLGQCHDEVMTAEDARHEKDVPLLSFEAPRVYHENSRSENCYFYGSLMPYICGMPRMVYP